MVGKCAAPCTIEAAVAYLGGMDGVGCLGSAANQMWSRTRQVWRRSLGGTHGAPGVAAVAGRNCTVGPTGLSNRWESGCRVRKLMVGDAGQGRRDQKLTRDLGRGRGREGRERVGRAERAEARDGLADAIEEIGEVGIRYAHGRVVFVRCVDSVAQIVEERGAFPT